MKKKNGTKEGKREGKVRDGLYCAVGNLILKVDSEGGGSESSVKKLPTFTIK